MLNDFEHVEPYHNYCEHCNVIYARVLEKYGIEYIRDNSKIENAECRSLLFEKGKCPDFDWRNITDDEIRAMADGDEVQVIDLKTEDNKYLHRDFHLLGDNALTYCGETYGDEAVVEFLTDYVKNYYAPIIEKIKKGGLSVLGEWIEKVYETEEATHLLNIEFHKDRLSVSTERSPVVEYMRSLNQEPGKYYIEETRTLYAVVAEECGFDFELNYYNDDGGTGITFAER